MEPLEKSHLKAPYRFGGAPYAERRILAGFLRAGDLPIVHPPSCRWPESVAQRVCALNGTSGAVPDRPEAGQCRLRPVEEPEALMILRGASQQMPFGPNVPVSYSWVDIKNLIATSSVADPLPTHPVVLSDDPGALARYSLFGPSVLELRSDGMLYSQTNVGLQLAHSAIEGGALVLKYKMIFPPEPVLVGYEQGRFYLLTAYGRVIQALMAKVERLLCLVYYGLDLGLPNCGVRVLTEGHTVNHFGSPLLSGGKPPLVRDFLDPSLTAVVPSRAEFFIGAPSFQLTAVTWPEPAGGALPLQYGSPAVESR
jgi:hypothetical protein